MMKRFPYPLFNRRLLQFLEIIQKNGGYLNEKEFEFTSGECDFDEPNLTSTLVDGCFSFEYDGNKSLLFLNCDGYIVRAVTTSASSFCPDFEYGSVWSVKN